MQNAELMTPTRIDTDSFFPLVMGPARYSGGEWNSFCKPDEERTLSVCLLIPEWYERAAHLTELNQIYHAGNLKPGIAVERAFLPKEDLTLLLEQKAIPLFSLESKRVLNDFDAVVVMLFDPSWEARVVPLLEAGRLSSSSPRPVVAAFGIQPTGSWSDVWIAGPWREVWDAFWERLSEAKAAAGSKEGFSNALPVSGTELLPLPLAPVVPFGQQDRRPSEPQWKGAVPCSCALCLRAQNTGSALVRSPKAVVQRIRVCFSRSGQARHLSHLEQIQVVRQAFRRSGLGVAHSQSKKPQLKLAFGPAVSVGYESRTEYVDADLTVKIEPERARETLSGFFPQGFSIVGVKRIPLFFPSLEAVLAVASYSVRWEETVDRNQISAFLERPSITMEKKKKDRIESFDLKPLLLNLEADGETIRLTLRFGPARNAKPERVVQLMLGLSEEATRLLRVTRTGLYWQDKNGLLREP